MSYQSVVASLGSALIGVCAALLTNWFQSIRKKTENAQEWYEKHYIFEGIDPQINALTNLNYFFGSTRLKLPLTDMKLEAPIETSERVQTLLNGGVFRVGETDFRDAIKYLYTKVQLMEAADVGSDKLIPWMDTTETMLSHLTDLRIQLLKRLTLECG